MKRGRSNASKFLLLSFISCLSYSVHAYGPRSLGPGSSSAWIQKVFPTSPSHGSHLSSNSEETFNKFGGTRSNKGKYRLNSSQNADSAGDSASESIESGLSQIFGELSRLKLWEEIALLEDKLSESTDPNEKKQIQQKIHTKKMEDPYIILLAEESIAVREQRLRDAAEIQIEMEKVGLPPPWREANKAQTSGLNRSISESDGIRVEAASFFSPEQSDPANGMYLFLYHIRITNIGDQTVQLVSREWNISPANGTGQMETVKGPGVVGQQPVLLPGQSFEYTSACPLRSNALSQLEDDLVGSMSGKYFFAAGDIGEQRFGMFINPFSFVLPTKF
mmetsp:Transcript_30096/g.39626  ORF Transcript_30096/g.39626 Transcript_30096/m.39626 type:complete len:334 (+) Transcript_30096:88-1089(+)|eukprot:CAMPEP_0117760402 /NCGR_PEP_ID=MMETSP0947-20121206/16606_1 /TAXON_ID=44440 /ORGANISM="Chattonella subsalsa, Strain CCMP2191" /LENGTH=333 /DNA_ID=CAMNT_0005581081 /DNA_START=86 /DNA_END=1087 /DNA_ORIENTATION=+